MKQSLVPLAVMLGLAASFAWSARAGDGQSVEERLARVELRLTRLEEALIRIAPPTMTETAPTSPAARMSANELAAIATLRNLVSAEAQLQASAQVDEDKDGTGEYGGFLELSGAVAGRMNRILDPPVLSPKFRVLNAGGEISRAGYFFRIFLPGKDGTPVAEPTTGFGKGGLVVDLAETRWCAYAWPISYGQSGNRVFFTNQEGDVLASEAAAYSGTTSGPGGDAASSVARRIDVPAATGAKGVDGSTWKRID